MNHGVSGEQQGTSDGPLGRSLSALVPMLLVAATMFNLATFGSYAASQGDRWGFRPGQSHDLADRIRSSGNKLLKEQWHLHLRIDDLLGTGDVLVLPEGHPLDERLLTYLVDVTWRGSENHASVIEGSRLARHLEDAQIWANGDGVPVALVDGGPGAEEFRAVAVTENDAAVEWVIAPGDLFGETTRGDDGGG